jgi:TrmH family RNA methyltransferase
VDLKMEFENLSQNQKKSFAGLKSKAKREKAGVFVAEGLKLCKELMDSDYKADCIVVRNEAGDEARELAEHYEQRRVRVYRSQNHHFDQIASTNSPQDILAIVKIKQYEEKIEYPIVILDAINDPGNLGTIIRTCDWFGFKRIGLFGECADVYNPKVVRASMGSIFRTKFSKIENIDYLSPKGIEYYAAVLGSKESLSEVRARGDFAIVLGSESHGITKELLKVCNKRFSIKGRGGAESLNVSIASGIILHHFSDFL